MKFRLEDTQEIIVNREANTAEAILTDASRVSIPVEEVFNLLDRELIVCCGYRTAYNRPREVSYKPCY